jgi:hypothetical protein
MTMLGHDDVDRAGRLAAPGPLSDRLGVAALASPDDARARVLVEIDFWRTTGSNPAFDPVTVEACDIAARCAEGLYAALA